MYIVYIKSTRVHIKWCDMLCIMCIVAINFVSFYFLDAIWLLVHSIYISFTSNEEI